MSKWNLRSENDRDIAKCDVTIRNLLELSYPTLYCDIATGEILWGFRYVY